MRRIALPTGRGTRVVNGHRHSLQSSLAAHIPWLAERLPSPPLSVPRAVRERLPRVPLAIERRVARQGSRRSLSERPRLHERLRPLAAAITSRVTPRRSQRSRWARARRALTRVDRRTLAGVAAGIAFGAFAMFLLDPAQGRRRRALMRDRIAHIGHVFSRDVERVERRGRFFRGVAKGLGHEAAGLVHLNGDHAPVDDETLVARVRSEVLRSDHWKAGEIHVEAYEGCVTLRGQMESESDISRLVNATGHVDGVREVRSYLHLPGTLPPNKAQSLIGESVPEYLHSP